MQLDDLGLAWIELSQPVERFSKREKRRQIPKDRRPLIVKRDFLDGAAMALGSASSRMIH
jgi:hypothetical protein